MDSTLTIASESMMMADDSEAADHDYPALTEVGAPGRVCATCIIS
jgi:hypothetical protein